MNCITKLNILLRLTNPDTIFVLYASFYTKRKTPRDVHSRGFCLKVYPSNLQDYQSSVRTLTYVISLLELDQP